MCAAAVNPATFLTDHTRAISVGKEVATNGQGPPPTSSDGEQETSMSLVWIITGVPNLTKVRRRRGHVSAITRPHQLHRGDWECGYYMSCMCNTDSWP